MSELSTDELRRVWVETVAPILQRMDLSVDQVEYLNLIPTIRERVCSTQQRKCDYLTNLHEIVARRCPKNKVGAPIVSDYDKINASFDEHLEALACVVDPKLRRKP